MEERRMEGGRLLKAGRLSKAEIARQLAVTRATVGTWSKTVQAGGFGFDRDFIEPTALSAIWTGANGCDPDNYPDRFWLYWSAEGHLHQVN